VAQGLTLILTQTMAALILGSQRRSWSGRIIRPPRRRRTPVMITPRLSRALLSIGLAGGMLFGLFNLTITENHRTDVVQSLASGRKSFVGPVDDPFFVDL
jgi:hypothetical protein